VPYIGDEIKWELSRSKIQGEMPAVGSTSHRRIRGT